MIDMDRSSFPDGLQKLLVLGGSGFIKMYAGSSKQQVVGCLNINDMKLMHNLNQSYCQVKVHESHCVRATTLQS